MKTTVYLSGPMSGVKDHNFPAFHAAAARLRDRGYLVISPAEMDEKEDFEIGSKPWDWYLRRDLRELLICDVVAVLTGWRKSRGAKLEVYVAQALGMRIMYADTLEWLGGQ